MIYYLLFKASIFSPENIYLFSAKCQDCLVLVVNLLTKPTGQGNGFVFLLAYDIIKADSGELKVKPQIENSVFVISIPA